MQGDSIFTITYQIRRQRSYLRTEDSLFTTEAMRWTQGGEHWDWTRSREDLDELHIPETKAGNPHIGREDDRRGRAWAEEIADQLWARFTTPQPGVTQGRSCIMYVIRYHGLYLSDTESWDFTSDPTKACRFDTEAFASTAAGRMSWHSTPDIVFRDLKVEPVALAKL